MKKREFVFVSGRRIDHGGDGTEQLGGANFVGRAQQKHQQTRQGAGGSGERPEDQKRAGRFGGICDQRADAGKNSMRR